MLLLSLPLARSKSSQLAHSIFAACLSLAGVIGNAHAATARVAAIESPKAGRVIVLGFDGADARTTLELMDKGELPNLDRLRKLGTFAPLGTTTPAESPVSWASLNSGQNPAKTAILGFVKRELTQNGNAIPAPGHTLHEERRSDSFAQSALFSFLIRHDSARVASLAGLAITLVFLLVFVVLLRLRKVLAIALALAFGAIGAWGGWAASTALPRTIAEVVGNPTQAGGFWEVAGKAGVPCIVLDAAMGWDRPLVANARVLAGLGVPDVRAANGDWFLYTTDENEFDRPPEGKSTPTGGTVFRVDERNGRIDSTLYGPIDYVALDRCISERDAIREELADPSLEASRRGVLDARSNELGVLISELKSDASRKSLPLTVIKKNGKAQVTLGGQVQELAEGEWSKWYRLSFEINALFKVKAVTRVKILKMSEPFTMYVDFLQIDPAAPPYWQAVSQPPAFAAELAKAIDTTYETVGWACMTMPFKDRLIDPATFLQDIEFTHDWREKILNAALARSDWRMLMNVESTPDRVQHMMYQFYDTGHPMYDATKAAAKTTYFGHAIALADAIPATYREMDRLVGDVLSKHVHEGDTLIVCADHGFQSFRRQVDLNNWLALHGYLVLREGLTRSQSQTPSQYVDWSRTRAYALGLGMIFLNLKRREPEGIVAPAEAPALIEKIRAELLDLVDPATGKKAVHAVYATKDIHSGPHLGDEADLMTGFEATYRVSWRTTLGGIRLVDSPDQQSVVAGPVFDDNKSNWSGDHVSVAEDLVRGIFFCNRKVELPAGGINLLHIAPTVLALLGVPVPPEYDLPPLRIGD